MVDDWKVLHDNNHIVGVIYMDLTKAFDCLPTGLIAAKLWVDGLSENVCNLSASYVSHKL